MNVKIGDIEVIPVSDGEAPPVDPSWPFPKVAAEGWERHPYALDSKGLHRSNFGGIVVRIGNSTVLVDAGLGHHPPKRYGAPPAELPASLKSVGLAPSDITMVVFTHLHYDHIGWSLSEDYKMPFFPNAKYVASQIDWDYWELNKDPARSEHSDAFKSGFAPLMDHGVVELVDGEKQLIPGMKTLATPGHTPGHMSLLLESNGVNGIVTGDVFHSAAQFAEPEWSHRADVDPAMGIETRKRLLKRLLPGMTIASGHLEHGRNIGTVEIVEGRRYWRGFDIT
jgi:glyoxylase-like metal-dependent hydrolase (beta-lactamase superfamily II)